MSVFHNMSSLSTRRSDYPTKTIAELATGTQNLSTLVKALGVTNMVQDLSSGGPFTVFAPTNSAFSRLGNEVLNNLINNPEELRDILKNHITLGKYFSNRLYDNQELRMTNGEVLSIKIRGDNILLLNKEKKQIARIKQKDIWGTNGVVYIIDRVLILKTMKNNVNKPNNYFQPPPNRTSKALLTTNVPLNSMFQSFRTGRMGCGCGG